MSNNKLKYIEELPDFINGKIQDEKLKAEIEKELQINKDLKKEYDTFKIMFSELKKTEAFNSPDNYLNNLLPRINNRLEKRFAVRIKNLILDWKIATSLAIILLFLILYKPIVNYFERKDDKIISLMDSSISTKKEQIKDTVINNYEEEKIDSKTVINTINKTINETNINKNTPYKIQSENAIFEFMEDDDLINSYDEFYDLENEFKNLKVEEQEKVLENFENLKI